MNTRLVVECPLFALWVDSVNQARTLSPVVVVVLRM